ncbi:MAG TPA: hypothetical protein VFW19_10485 [Allosphingosinicella sp.]|nr:hypothetical protein [Allosphingosinicella sp.]
MTDLSDDAHAYYADGFRRTIGGVPCKVFSRRTADGRYIRAKGSPFYDPAFDHPKTGQSRSTPASAETVAELERKEAIEAIAAFARATAEPRDNVVLVDFGAGADPAATTEEAEPEEASRTRGTIGRAERALAMLTGERSGLGCRSFDNCFEESDGAAVAAEIVARLRTDRDLARRVLSGSSSFRDCGEAVHVSATNYLSPAMYAAALDGCERPTPHASMSADFADKVDELRTLYFSAVAPSAAPEIVSTVAAALPSGAFAVQADMRARLAALQARIAPEPEPEEAWPDYSPLPADPRARALRGAGRLTSMSTRRRSPARERLLRRYLAMRAEREALRRQLSAAWSLHSEARTNAREIEAAQNLTWQARERAVAKRRRAVGHIVKLRAARDELRRVSGCWQRRATMAEDHIYSQQRIRERDVGHIVKLRQRRAMDRLALHAAGEAVRDAKDEVRRIKVETAPKPIHQNEPAPALVAQLHDEREMAAAAIKAQSDRADRLERANAVLIREVETLASRAARAEAALRLRDAAVLPRLAHVGTPSARVSFQLPAVQEARQ